MTITNSSTNVDTHKWTFGDGNESTDKSTFHKYQDTGTYTVTYEATNNCGTVDSSFELKNYWVSVRNIVPNINFKAYPQPADQTLYIELENDELNVLDISLFDVTGKLIQQHNNYKLTDRIARLDINEVSTGTYVLRISGEEYIGRKMLLIK